MRKKLTNGLVSVLVSAMVMTSLPCNLMTAKATETQEAIGVVESVSDADVGTYTTLEDVVIPNYQTEETDETSGTLGDNGGFQWSYDDSNATLTVTGEDSGLNELRLILPQSVKKKIRSIVFQDCVVSGSLGSLVWGIKPESVEFRNCDTSNVTDISGMFSGCSSLSSVDLSNFDTSNVTDMFGMFSGCSSLSSVDLSSFDTSNVTDMNGMFFDCGSLSSVEISGFDTGNVTDMGTMFYGCSSLSSVDLSGFDTKNVLYMHGMFYDCSNLKSVDISSFDTSNVTNMRDMFYDCSSLSSVDLSNINTSNVTDMSEMFYGCSNLSSVDLSGFDTSNVTNMRDMFYRCEKLVTIKTPNVMAEGQRIVLPQLFFDEQGNEVTQLTLDNCNTTVNELIKTNALEFVLGEEQIVKLTEGESFVSYRFTPEVRGKYRLWSDGELYYTLYNEGMKLIKKGARVDQDVVNSNVLEAGETYYFKIYDYKQDLKIKLTKEPMLVEASVLRQPDQTSFYYGLEYAYYDGLVLQLQFDDETLLETRPGDDTWKQFGIRDGVVHTATWEDLDYPWPIGSYYWAFRIPGIEELVEVPFEVVDPKEKMEEFILDEELSVDGQIFRRFTPEVKGNYGIWSDTKCHYVLYNEEMEQVKLKFLVAGEKWSDELEAGQTYYYRIVVDSDEDATIKLTKGSFLVEASALLKRTSFYYGLNDDDYDDLVLQLHWDDGTLQEIQLLDDIWMQMGIRDYLYTAKGEYANYHLSIGSYYWQFIIPGLEEPIIVPFEIVDPKESMEEFILEEEQSVEEGIFRQFTPNVKGTYELWSDGACNYTLYNEEMERLDSGSICTGDKQSWELEAGRTYYYVIHTYDKEVKVKLTKKPMLVDASVLQQPNRTSFYYGLEDAYYDGLVLQLHWDDGTLQEIQPWDDTWEQMGIREYIYTATGEYPDYPLSIGSYYWQFTIPELEEAIIVPFEIVDPKESMEEFILEEEQSVEEQIFRQFTPNIKGTYELWSDGACNYTLYNEEMERLYTEYIYADNKHSYELEAGQTYYYEIYIYDKEVKVKLTKKTMVVEASILHQPEQTSFYYGLESESISGLILQLDLDNGEQLEISAGDDNWDRYVIESRTMDSTGEDAEYDINGYLPTGSYYWEIIINDLEEAIIVPFEIVDPKESMEEFILDEEQSIEERKFCQFTPEVKGTYGLWANGECFYTLYNEEMYKLDEGYLGDEEKRCCVLESGQTYYYTIYTDGEEVTVKLTKEVVLTSITLSYKEGEPEYYGGFLSSFHTNELQVGLVWEDGTEENIPIRSNEFNDYNLLLNMKYADSNQEAEADEEGYYLPGEYMLTVTDSYGHTSNELPLTIKDKKEMPILRVGETLSELQVGNNYYSYFQIEIEEAGNYYLDISLPDYWMEWIDDNGTRDDNETNVIQSDGPNTYYVEIDCRGVVDCVNKGMEYEVFLKKLLSPIDLELTYIEDKLVYNFGLNSVENIWKSAQFQLVYEDGSREEMSRYDLNWDVYQFDFSVYDVNGLKVYPDSLSVGEYMLKVYSSTYENCALDIPFQVLPLTEFDPFSEMESVDIGESITVKPFESKILAVDLSASHVYEVKAQSGNGGINLYDKNTGFSTSTLVSDYMEDCFLRLSAGRKYLQIINFGGETLELHINRCPDITSLEYNEKEAIEFTYGSWGYYIGVGPLTSEMVKGEECITPADSNVLVEMNGKDYYNPAGNLWFDISLDAGMSDGTEQKIFYNSWMWNVYDFIQKLFDAEGEEVYTDDNGYVPIGEYVAEFTANGASVQVPFSVTESDTMKDLRKAVVTFPEQLYTGEALTPAPKVVYGSTELEKDKDYTITYSDNVEAGTANAVLKGKGNYSGTLKTTFIIKAAGNDTVKAPAISDITGCDGKATITWKKVSGATGYIVYRKTGKESYNAVKTIIKGDTVNYTDSTVKSGMTYTYAVTAVNGTDESVYSTGKTVKIIKSHQYEDVVTRKATNKKNGTVTPTCELCGKTGKQVTVYAAKTVKLAKDSYTYDGKAKKPSVTVKDSKGKKVSSKYYKVSYKNNKKVGTATVTISFKGNYSGKVTRTFTIAPKGTAISKVTADQKGFTVKWKKQNNQTTGYQIQYSTKKSFKSAKTITVNKNATVSQKVKGLKAKQKYYVRVRTFKKQKVSGKNQMFYSAWSSAKAVTTKK